MVARNLQPISIVEGAGFKHLLSYLEPRYRVPSQLFGIRLLRKQLF